MTDEKDKVELSQEEQEELMAKYDAESRTRKLTGSRQRLLLFYYLPFLLSKFTPVFLVS